MSIGDSPPTPSGAEEADQPSKIIVGYDGSESARRGSGRVARLAWPRASVVVIAAIEPYPRSRATMPVTDTQPRSVGAGVTSTKRRPCASKGVDASTSLLKRDPAEALIDAAQDADLVVVGTRSLSRVQSFVLGSVSSKVVSRAPCDVLVVR